MIPIALLTHHNDRFAALLETAGITQLATPSEAPIWLAEPALAAEALRQGSKPQWLASTYAGIEPLMAADLAKDYQLTNVRGIFGPLMAQYVFAHLLSRLRHLPRYATQQEQHLWQPHSYGSLQGQTLVLLGTGDIARHIASVAAAFGMRIIGVNRRGHAVDGFERIVALPDLNHALALADVLVSVLPSTPQSHHLLNAKTLAALPSHATLINVGRGSVLDIDALLARLDAGQLAHAVLDVFESEPLPQDSPLWQHPQVSLTPHVAATSFPEQVVRLFVDNLRRFERSERLQHLVDFTQGY
ncbi:D-2-hydroxyacid dehydrogenase [Ferrimonas pelagia]|uniref:D-2-hydroxyacid dehydrogenase n=1 Tax=Ferrimonas pelagia TaxID=1177826 RepID=A0ABP9E843_9GAMM